MLYSLVAIACVLTFLMFHSRQRMLGFPCAIFWALLGGYAYTHSVYDWDTYYFLFFASFGMMIFCTFAAFALRASDDTKTDEDEYLDEEKDKTKYIDEKGKSEEPEESERTKNLHKRADQRRKGPVKSRRL